jgi:transposase, IS30 family
MVDYARGTITQQVPPVLEKVLNPRFLTLLERERIADRRAGGASMRAVAAVRGRAPSAISPELARDTYPDPAEASYRPYAAHRAAAARRSRSEPAKLVAHPALADYVQAGLDQRWSP